MKKWSVSKVSMYQQCPLSYKYNYIDKIKKADNPWSLAGSFCHSVLEKIMRGELLAGEDALLYFIKNYPKEIKFFYNGKDHSQAMFEKLKKFFFLFKQPTGNLLGIERRFSVKINDDHEFIGFIDLESEKNGTTAITDYKISTPYRGDQRRIKLRQQYLYSLAFKEHYGSFPDILGFVFIKDNVYDYESFNEDWLMEAKNWLLAGIEDIELAEAIEYFPATPDKFFCQHLCNARLECPHAKS